VARWSQVNKKNNASGFLNFDHDEIPQVYDIPQPWFVDFLLPFGAATINSPFALVIPLADSISDAVEGIELEMRLVSESHVGEVVRVPFSEFAPVAKLEAVIQWLKPSRAGQSNDQYLGFGIHLHDMEWNAPGGKFDRVAGTLENASEHDFDEVRLEIQSTDGSGRVSVVRKETVFNVYQSQFRNWISTRGEEIVIDPAHVQVAAVSVNPKPMLPLDEVPGG
jgi:hypothetical protein